MDTCPTKFNFAYLVNVPIWLKIIDLLIPEKHKSRIKICNKKTLLNYIGAEALALELGGELDISAWDDSVNTWAQENVKGVTMPLY